MPNEYRQSGRERPDTGFRGDGRGARGGGRSEENARQRNAEQLRAGYSRDEWNRQTPTHNVRSEPRWDPNEWRGGQSEFRGGQARGQYAQGRSYDQGRGGFGAAGGRSEQNARERNWEQVRAGYGSDEWHRQPPTHNVRSEPHWDPSDSHGGQDFRNQGYQGDFRGQNDYRGQSSMSWDDDRYIGGPSYESREPERGSRHWYDERNFAGRERWRDEQDDRGYQNQGYHYQGYGEMRGGLPGFGGERFTRGERPSDFGRGGMRDEGEGHEGHEGFGQQLQDAGRRLVGRVKRLVRNPKNYKRSDERIREDVCDRLALSDEVDPSEVEVTVQNGEVTLTGTVDNRHMKFLAEEIADDIPGVHDVHNQLRIKRADQGQGTLTNSTSNGGSAQDVQRGRNLGRS